MTGGTGSQAWNIAGSADTTLNVNTSAPAVQNAAFINNVALTTGTGDWDVVGDVLTLTYSADVSLNTIAADDTLTQAQVRAITGVDVVFAGSTTVTVTKPTATTVVLTIGGADLTTGIGAAVDVPGTVTALVRDTTNSNNVGPASSPESIA